MNRYRVRVSTSKNQWDWDSVEASSPSVAASKCLKHATKKDGSEAAKYVTCSVSFLGKASIEPKPSSNNEGKQA